jgi:hypothetical protein
MIMVRLIEPAEGFLPLGGFIKAIGVVDGMPRFMAQGHHEFVLVFQVSVHPVLDLGKDGVGVIERDSDRRHSIGTAPGVGQVEFGFEADPLSFQFPMKPGYEFFQFGAFDLQAHSADRLIPLHQRGFPVV